MTKIDIFSGFLGAGKTTLIKKLIKEAYSGEQIVLIENEFGEIGIDGGFMAEAGVKINELNSGCICCSLVGDFAKALKQVYADYKPDRILIEPSGVGKLSDVIRAVANAGLENCKINSSTTVVDAAKCKMYMKNFGEFFNDQIEAAGCIVFSHVDVTSEEKLNAAVALVREKNPDANIVTTALGDLDGKDIVAAMEHSDSLESEIEKLLATAHEEHHHHHHHDGDEDEDEDEDECCEDEDEDEDECCEEDHDHEHEHEHHHHHHHHADEVFSSWGVETSKKFDEAGLKEILDSLVDGVRFGVILRAKGIVQAADGGWIHFDYIPGETDIRRGPAATTGRLCVIGSKVDEEELAELFGV